MLALFSYNINPTELPPVDDWFQCEQGMVSLRQIARTHKRFADSHRCETPQLNSSNWVWLTTKDIRGLLGLKKLNACYVWFFKVLCQISHVTFKLDLPRHCCLASSFHVSQKYASSGIWFPSPQIPRASGDWRLVCIYYQGNPFIKHGREQAGIAGGLGGVWPWGKMLSLSQWHSASVRVSFQTHWPACSPLQRAP